MGHQNTKKHKAQHGGYRDKPTQRQVKANLDFWAELFTTKKEGEYSLVLGTPGKGTPRLGTPVGTQLKLNL